MAAKPVLPGFEALEPRLCLDAQAGVGNSAPLANAVVDSEYYAPIGLIGSSPDLLALSHAGISWDGLTADFGSPYPVNCGVVGRGWEMAYIERYRPISLRGTAGNWFLAHSEISPGTSVTCEVVLFAASHMAASAIGNVEVYAVATDGTSTLLGASPFSVHDLAFPQDAHVNVPLVFPADLPAGSYTARIRVISDIGTWISEMRPAFSIPDVDPSTVQSRLPLSPPIGQVPASVGWLPSRLQQQCRPTGVPHRPAFIRHASDDSPPVSGWDFWSNLAFSVRSMQTGTPEVFHKTKWQAVIRASQCNASHDLLFALNGVTWHSPVAIVDVLASNSITLNIGPV